MSALTKQCAPVHCQGESTCPSSVIVSEGFDELAATDIS
jgi:hypothetical protein